LRQRAERIGGVIDGRNGKASRFQGLTRNYIAYSTILADDKDAILHGTHIKMIAWR